ncbi:MAG: AEC family transporter [Spirochaetes bacterium]|nr:AEC family transporter [Spirochaetota bacterium]
MVLAVFYALLQLLFLSGLGFFLSRLRGWPRELFHGFNRFVAGVALPVSFFTSIARTEAASLRAAWIFPIVAVAVMLLGLAFSAPLFGLAGFSRENRRAGMGLSTFGNSGYLPLALMEILPLSLPALSERFGFSVVPLYIGTFLLVNSPILWSLGNWLVAGTGRPRLGELITPPFIGIVAGLAVVGFGLQRPLLDQALPFFHVFRALERIGATTVPLIMVALGAMIGELAFEPGTRRGLFGMAAAVSVVRFVLFPAAFVAAYFLVLKPLAFSPAQVWTIFLLMHLPPATNFSVMASRAGKNEAQVSFTLLATYLVYLAALPLYLLLFLRLVDAG